MERAKKARQELAKEKATLKESLKSGNAANARLTQLNDEALNVDDQVQSQQEATEDIVKSIAALQAASASDRAALDAASKEAAHKLALLDKLRTKMQSADDDLRAIESTRSSWADKIEQRKLELRAASTAAAVALRAIDVAAREREVLNHDHAALSAGLRSKRDALHVAENQSRSMEIELRAFDVSVRGWKALIDALAQDTDAFQHELEARQVRTQKAVEKAAAKDAQVRESARRRCGLNS